jgi:MFS family permease
MTADYDVPLDEVG